MKSKRLSPFVAAIFVGFGMLLASHAVLAQEEENHWKVSLDSRYVGSSDVSRMSGEVQTTESNFKLDYTYKVADKLPVELGLDYKHIDIDEDVAVELPTHLEGFQASIGTKFPLPFLESDRHFLGIDLMPRMYTDDGSWKSSAFRMPVRIYAIYKESDDFIVVAGVQIRADYDTAALPIIGVIYRPNDRLSFNLASDEPNISYKLDDLTSAFVEFGYTLDEYEVTRLGQDGRILKYKEFLTGVGLKYALQESLEASLSGGGVFSRRLEYEDPIGKVEPDAGLYVKGKLALKF